MSMRTSGGSALGCLIQGKDIAYFIEKYIEMNPIEFQDCDLEEAKDIMHENLMLNESFVRSSCIGKPLQDCGDNEMFSATMTDEGLFYPTVYIQPLKGDYQEINDYPVIVYADKPSVTKRILEGDFYKSKQELVDEFKDKLSKYLPENFDYEGSIADIEYALCC